MALPKYTDPAVQNQTQDDATEHIDNLHSRPIMPGINKNENKKPKNTGNDKDKIKSYKEGNKSDIPEDDNREYDDIENDFDDKDDGDENESVFYGRGL